jgi:hypothetical protein
VIIINVINFTDIPSGRKPIKRTLSKAVMNPREITLDAAREMFDEAYE